MRAVRTDADVPVTVALEGHLAVQDTLLPVEWAGGNHSLMARKIDRCLQANHSIR